jgi:hypothetical protein
MIDMEKKIRIIEVEVEAVGSEDAVEVGVEEMFILMDKMLIQRIFSTCSSVEVCQEVFT